MQINQDFVSPCGLYCGVCGVYYATRDKNNKFMEKLIGVYEAKMPGLNLSIEDLQCKGCLSDTVSVFCRKCNIKSCVQEKGYSGCHQCDDFPCRHIDEFVMPVGKKVIMSTTNGIFFMKNRCILLS